MADTKNRISKQGLIYDTSADRCLWEESSGHALGWGASIHNFEENSDDSPNICSLAFDPKKFWDSPRIAKYAKKVANLRRGQRVLANDVVVLTRAQYDNLLSRVSALEVAVQPPAVPARHSLSQTTIDALRETAKQLFGNAELHEEIDDEGAQRPVVRVCVADGVEPASASKLASAWYQRLVELEPDAKPGLISLSIQFL